MFNKFKRKRIINFSNENIIKKKNPIILFLKVFFLITVVIFILLYNGYSNFKKDILNKKEIIINIKAGENISDLAQKLDLNENYLKLYIKKNNPSFSLITGNFKISTNANINKILIDLETPLIENEINITILEGWNIYDIDNYLAKKILIKKGEYIKYVQNKEKIDKLTIFFPFIEGMNTLEGYLYPDTYTVISNNFKINVFVIKQLENFEEKVYNKILTEHKNKKIEEIINLASIVEKEEKNIREKSTVAGILKKRLDNGWMIGADITVCYPHALTANECKMVITKYIREKSEYNTRTMQGLPKTPIGNPSFETINATLNYKKTSHWFYLHDTKTGKIYYAETNEGHTINKNRYLR